MKKFSTLLFLFALGAASALAEHVTPARALERLAASQPAGLRKSPSRLAHGAKLAAERSEIYLFTTADDGFIILPANDIARPLLAYGTAPGALDNPQLNYWLETYSAEIRAAASAGSVRASNEVVHTAHAAIAPMTQTRWNQSEPYNDMCPTLNGSRCVTGCVATAMAQVMRYHSWPEKGVGEYSYQWSTGSQTLSFNYAATTFRWDLMLNEYGSDATAEQKDAVATLMYAAGVSVDMDYTSSESGAVSQNMGRAFLENFNYDQGLWMAQRDYYGLVEWEDIIYNELAEGRPVLYGGTGEAGGHQFVADGYSADGFFHFNWGWGGMSDGYFALTALNPPSLGIGGGAGGFNYNQSALIGLQPPVSGSKPTYLMYCTGSFEPTAASATLGSQVGFTGGFFNYGFTEMPAGTHVGLIVEPISPAGTPTYIVCATTEIKPNYGTNALYATIPADLSAGTYRITPAYKVPDGEWTQMRAPLSNNGELTAIVSGQTVRFTAPDSPEITINDFTLSSPLYWSKDFELTFTIVNDKSEEYYGGLTPILISSDGTSIVAQASPYPVDLQGDASEDVTYSGVFSAQSAPAAGSYYLGLYDATTSTLVCDPIAVTLNDAPAETKVTVTNLRLKEPVTDPAEVTFVATVECTEGYFAGTLQVPVFASTGGASLYVGHTATLYLEAGQSKDIEITLDLSSLASGSYEIGVYNDNSPVSDYEAFELSDESTIISSVNNAAQPQPMFDLLGRRVAGNARPGIYVTSSGLIRR